MGSPDVSLRHFRKQLECMNELTSVCLCRGYSFRRAVFSFSLVLIICSGLVSGGSSDDDATVVADADYSALQAIKQELIDFRGLLRSWNGRNGVCSGGWVGITCQKGHIVVIQLPWKGLGGRLSEKIGNLWLLRRISLHDNVLAGPVPHSLWSLPNLRGLYLFNNRFSGSIPQSISQTPSLQNLDLSNNQLNGSIPHILSNSSRIYRLNLSHNAFSGSIPPSLTLVPSLTFLALEHNNLSGSIPNTWGLGKSGVTFGLKSLTLDHNFLTGNLPDSLSKMDNLEKMNLGHNHIYGVIPGGFDGLSRLRFLDLSNNGINGTFPHLSSSNLSVLILSNNRLSGVIPGSIRNLLSLTQLDLSHNSFTGEIPADLKSLDSLNVSYNALSGSVPKPLLEKFDSSSFVGNLQLCGYSVSAPCPSSPSPSPSPSQILPSPPPKHRNRKLSTKDIILIASGALLLVLLLLCFLLLCCLIRKKSAKAKSKKGKTNISMPVAAEVAEVGEAGGKLVHFSGQFVFTADDLLCATAEIMGKSTYGTAYKATLEDGSTVAVKRLREKVTKPQKEFEAEVAELGKIRHENVLALRAYYLGPKGEKLLVFDYMPNGSLASFLHARGPETSINWPTRRNIIVGITRGLSYLHNHENIVHGNLTSTNVLLDEHRRPSIADVGLSRLMTAAAAANTAAAATLGYRAPELSKPKTAATTKTDVYSLGVVMLELLTGKPPGEAAADGGGGGGDLPEWVASIVKEEWTNEVFDLELMGDPVSVGVEGEELLSTLKLAMHCVDPSPAERPEAQQVLEKLEEIRPEAGPEAVGPSSKID